MTDYIPPSEPGDKGSDGRGNEPDRGSMPPTSNWGQAPRPADWRPGDDLGPSGFPQQPSPSQPGFPNHDPYGAQAGSYTAGYVRGSQATTALVLVICGLFCCGFPAIIGTIMAKTDLNAIRRGATDPGNQGTAQAAFIVGIIASILWLAVAGIWFLATLISFAASS